MATSQNAGHIITGDAALKRPYQNHAFLPLPHLAHFPGVYAIINQQDAKVYIGSAQNISVRCNHHRWQFDRKKNTPRLQQAFDQNPENFYVEVIEELPHCTIEQRLERETFWIQFYKAHLPKFGYNRWKQADSCKGITYNEEIRRRAGEARRGWKMTPEQLERHSKAMRGHKGRSFTNEQRAEMSRIKSGTHMSEVAKAKRRITQKLNKCCYKPVDQYTLNGSFVRRFDSVTEAELFFGKRSNIHAACKGKRNFAFGFKWRYVNGN